MEHKLKNSDNAYCSPTNPGLKKYSDWPTYPQVYSNGELIGGLDIIKVRIVHIF